MKFLILSTDSTPTKSKLESVEKILTVLYGSTKTEVRTSKAYASTIKKAVEDGYKVFDVSSKKTTEDGAYLVDLKKQTSEFLYNLVEYVGLGISEKSIQKAIQVVNGVK